VDAHKESSSAPTGTHGRPAPYRPTCGSAPRRPCPHGGC